MVSILIGYVLEGGFDIHRVCLRGWLEQDTVCPTCRFSLSEDLRQGGQPNRQGQVIEEERGRGRRFRRNMRNARNWLLRFNGASIASWLPTFSLELHQEDGQRWISDAADVHRVVSSRITEKRHNQLAVIQRWSPHTVGPVYSGHLETQPVGCYTEVVCLYSGTCM